MINKILKLLILLLCLNSCSSNSWYDQNEELVFQTGFNGTAINKKNDASDSLTGEDTSFSEKSNWDNLVDHKYIGNSLINYEAGNSSQRYASIVTDPGDNINQVMKFCIIEPHITEGDHMKGRVSLILSELAGIYSISQTVRLYLHPDMEHLKEWDNKVDWLTIFEYWSSDWSRITISIDKPTDDKVSEMNFKVSCTTQSFGKWYEQWTDTAKIYSVPFGKWISIEIYSKTGDEKTGKFFMAVKDENTPRKVIFDLNKSFGNGIGFTKLNPLKLYTSDKLINYMKSKNLSLSVYWDDWKLFRNKPID